MEIYILKNMFAVCKIPDFSRIDLNREFYFAANTDEECSLVCPRKISERTQWAEPSFQSARAFSVSFYCRLTAPTNL